MKRLIYIISMLLVLFSCHSIADEPEANPRTVQFGKNGGETTVRITRHDGKPYSDRKAPWYYKPEGKAPILKTETLPNGELKYFNDWLTFIVPPSFNSIKIIAKRNDTKAKRSYMFTGYGDRHMFTVIISQE